MRPGACAELARVHLMKADDDPGRFLSRIADLGGDSSAS
jgi:hypothetical protein